MAMISEALNIALQHHQAGRLREAEALYRQILQAQPEHPDALHLLGVIAQQVGQYDVAIRYINRAIAVNAQAAEFHNNIGEAYRAMGKLEEAVTHYRQAVALKPTYTGAYSNLGNALREQGKLKEAVTQYRQALALQPTYAEAHNNLGAALFEQGKLEEAVAQYRQALALEPTYAEAHNNLGAALHEQGKLEEAVLTCRQALALKPSFAEAHNRLGAALHEQGKLVEAEACFRQALALKPGYAEAHNNLGVALREQGKLEEALAHYRQALALKPMNAEAHSNLGSALKEQGKLEEALGHYRQALALKPALAEAHKNMGNALHEQGKLEEALVHYRQALTLKPNDGLKILIATALPVIAQSKAHLYAARNSLTQQVSGLLNQDLSLVNPLREAAGTNFYLGYQGLNDRDIQQSLSRLYAQACPSLIYTAAHCQPFRPVPADCKIKVGFISKFFRNHTIGMLMRGIIAQLSRKHFSVIAFTFPNQQDQISELISRQADRMVVLPPTLEAARQQIAQEQLDILFYADIGMDPLTYFLAFSRLAPVQCVTWGHPVTTGIRTIDYFISSESLEPDHAEQHYSEQLIRLKHLPTYYYRPTISTPLKSRRDFGLEDGRRIYLCPQSLFKLHPDFDEVMARILRADQQGEVILIEGVAKHWNELLANRFQETIPDVVDRIRFLPRQTSPDFRRLLAVADVILDPLHWSGGSTTYEALLSGTPIITLPSEFMRGRVTYACYQQMGMMECVASSTDDYVKKAVRLGTDPKYREKVKGRILAANDVLYENAEVVRDFERFFKEAVDAARRGAEVGRYSGGA